MHFDLAQGSHSAVGQVGKRTGKLEEKDQFNQQQGT